MQPATHTSMHSQPKLKPILTSRCCLLTSRQLMTLLAGRPCCPHCAKCRKLQPCSRESVYVWAAGSQAHRITQAEGGEQGDPLMPALFASAFAPARRDLHADLRPDEQALAFLDDAYILAPPHRALQLYHRFEGHTMHRAHLRLNPGKTRVWNSAGVHPHGVDSLAPDGDVWVGNLALDSAQRDFVALGVPLGTPEFVAAFLETLARKAEGPPRPFVAPCRHSSCVVVVVFLCCPSCPLRAAHTASGGYTSVRRWA